MLNLFGRPTPGSPAYHRRQSSLHGNKTKPTPFQLSPQMQGELKAVPGAARKNGSAGSVGSRGRADSASSLSPAIKAKIRGSPGTDDDALHHLRIYKKDLWRPRSVDSSKALPRELSEVLRSPQSRNRFRRFLRKHFAAENLLLFETIEMYQRIDNDEWRVAAGQQIVERFIHEHADFAVNLSGQVRGKILATKHFRCETFNAAKREVFTLMEDNFFARFVEWCAGDAEAEREVAKSPTAGNVKGSPRSVALGSPPAPGSLRTSARRLVDRLSGKRLSALLGSPGREEAEEKGAE
jgi:hypothetical protein